MNQAEWLCSADPKAMLRLYVSDETPWRRGTSPPVVSDRKLRLFACACVRSRGRSDPAVVDGYEQNGAPADDLDGYQTTDLRWAQAWTERGSGDDPPLAARAALLRDVVGDPFAPPFLPWRCRGCGIVCGPPAPGHYCVRCGSDEAGVCPWRTPDALALAQAAYDSPLPDGTLDRLTLAAVADALEEAGCPAEESFYGETECPDCEGAGEVYGDYFAEDGMGSCDRCGGKGVVRADSTRPHPLPTHLRSPGSHVRGCWALDLLLGLE